MKFLLVVALLAGVHADADAEADPQLLLAGTPLVYGAAHAVVHTPVVKTVEVKPVEVETTPLVYSYTGYPYAGVYGYPYVYGHGLPLTVAAPAAAAEEEAPAVEAERKKREAEPEADPEADPWYLTYGYHAPVVYKAPEVKTVEVKTTPVVYNSLVHPYTYGHYGYGYPYAYSGYHYPYTYGYHVVPAKPAEEAEAAVESERKRRDADAEAEADPAVLASYSRILNPAPVTYTLPAVTHGVYAGYAGYPYASVYGYGRGFWPLGK